MNPILKFINDLKTILSTPTVSVDQKGKVQGDKTHFTNYLVGKKFKSAGHIKYYSISKIINKKRLVLNPYNGGVISGGTTFEIK